MNKWRFRLSGGLPGDQGSGIQVESAQVEIDGGAEALIAGHLRSGHDRGFSEAFVGKYAMDVRRSDSWNRAIKAAGSSTKSAMKLGVGLGIADNSVDLVTSSMVMSQLQHEPWGFFSRASRERLGEMGCRVERKHRSELGRLHDDPIAVQVQRHLAEVQRILKPSEHFFVAFELFGRDRGHVEWRMLEHMTRILIALGKRFEFDFDLVEETRSLSSFSMQTSESLVQSYVLTTR